MMNFDSIFIQMRIKTAQQIKEHLLNNPQYPVIPETDPIRRTLAEQVIQLSYLSVQTLLNVQPNTEFRVNT